MRAWLTMDKKEVISLHFFKPRKYENFWSSIYQIALTQEDLPEGINPQWTDVEPTEVEINIKAKEA